MRTLLTLLFAAALAASGTCQTVHDYASVEFSPGIRKLGVFGTGLAGKVVDLKTVNMAKRDQDILVFFQEVQELERQGWQLTGQDVVALDKGVHLYVWTLRRARPRVD